MNAPLNLGRTAIKPARLAHVVFRTNQLQNMVRWYCTVLGAEIAHSDAKIAFITYDDEHHRVAFVAASEYDPKPARTSVGFYHFAFSYRNLGELLSTYLRLKDAGIKPWRAIHHGPTVSFYFKDPDDNDVELQVDSFAEAARAVEYMRGPKFAENPIGINFDPEDLVARYQAGEPEARLIQRPDSLS